MGAGARALAQGNTEVVHTAVADTAELASEPSAKAANPASDGLISGTVMDTSGAVVQGVKVELLAGSTHRVQTVQSGSDGQFIFHRVANGNYTIRVNGTGMTPYTSGVINFESGGALIVPPITMDVSGGVTSVTVSGNPETLSQEQVQIAVHQRIGGVIPNFYSSYDWNAPPMLAKQKYVLSIRSILDPVSFASVAAVAGAEQYRNVFPAYGSGWEGYGKRYGAAMANHVSSNLLGKAVYPSLFHEDPRYFYKGTGSIRSRALYAMSAAVIARGDDGKWKPNYANVLGNFSAGALSNLYYPAADRGLSLTLLNGVAETGADAASNLIREFVLKRFTSHVPKDAH